MINLHTISRVKFVRFFTYFIRLKSSSFASNGSKINKLILEMPKERTHIAEAQKQRLRIKEKAAKYIPGTVNLQVLGSGAPGAPASVYLFTDQCRYLFNCGEGTQRLAHEHKTKLARLEHIFMTRTSWNHVGGLPGLSLTVQDAGVPNLTLHGPYGLEEIFRGMRKFVVLKHLRVNTVNCENGGGYEDQVMDVTYVPLKKKDARQYSEEKTPSPEPEIDETDYYANERENSRDNAPILNADMEKREQDVVISYICKLKPRPGSLNLHKCVEKGIPAGPLLGQLKSGFDVTLEDGTLVRATDVCGATDPGPVFVFIDIPGEEYLDSLEQASEVFSQYQATALQKENIALVVVHFSSQEIMCNPIYKNFVDKFHSSTTHLALNSINKFSGYVAAHRIQWQLHQMNEFVFPLLKEHYLIENSSNTHKRIKISGETKSSVKSDRESNNRESHEISWADHVESLTSYHLRPRKGLDRSPEPIVNPQEYIQECSAVEGFTESLSELKNKMSSVYSLEKYDRRHDLPKVIFLGTGSCIPNKTRNVSAILIQTSEDGYVLLDCGEGTWGQMYRFFGQEKFTIVLEKLRAVYISHLHADHHIGLIGLMLKRREVLGSGCPPLYLFAPQQIQSWFHFYNQKIESIKESYHIIANGDLQLQPYTNSDLLQYGIRSISTCLVHHCPHAFGVAIELSKTLNNEPIKITYSGDTMPCEDLVELGRNSTILIHEATMEDELTEEAKYKLHSTVSQAIDQGVKMNAKYTILTHFSQRYAKLPRIEQNLANNVGIAFDNMEITLQDLDYLHLMYPTLKIMFSEHCEEMEQKAIKRALKLERKRRSASLTPPR